MSDLRVADAVSVWALRASMGTAAAVVMAMLPAPSAAATPPAAPAAPVPTAPPAGSTFEALA